MCPHKTKRGGELPTLATRPRVGPKTLANPQPTRVGKRGSRGRSPLAGGRGGCPPTNSKEGRVAHISHPATSGTQNAGKPSANGGGQKGVEGAKPPGQVKPDLSLSAKVPQHRNKTQKHRHVEIHPVNVKVVKKIVHSKVNKTPNCPYEQSPLPAHL